MQKLLVVGIEAEEKRSSIGRLIEEKLPFQVFSVFSLEDMQEQLKSKLFNLVVFDAPVADEKLLATVSWLREKGHNFPVLVACDKVQGDIATELTMLTEVHILRAPFHDKDVTGLVRKMMSVKRVPRQVFRRFETNQIAEMETLTSGDCMLTSMYNLSKGGAYCEFDCPNPLSIGDLFKLKVVIDDTNSEYTLNAKVVWTTQRGRFSGRFGCGFKFVSAQDTYKYLLSKT